MKYKKIVYALAVSGLLLASLASNAKDAVVSDAQDEKIKARLAEIAAEAKKANLEKMGHYVERRSYGTQKETDPPRYVRQANKTWLKDYDTWEDVDWLDLGLEYRIRTEYRDNDYRRNDGNTDYPTLLRTRVYVGVKNILDPLRFTVELQDSRRNNGDYTREFDTRDVNQHDILQGYLELNFKETFLGKDDLGNNRPIWIRAGRHAWEAIDRRLIARNEWRNTTNNFQGLRAYIGDKKNDWDLELMAVNPIQRHTRRMDEVDHAQDFYGAIFNWRGWSEYITLEPHYFLLKQDGSEVKYNTGGQELTGNALRQAQIDREIHTAGLRAYGVVGKTGFDYDYSYVKQWGEQQRFLSNALGYTKVDHDAYAYNAEVGYSMKHAWSPRFSAFYGVATGDRNPPSGTDRTQNERFERLFGFARPWSNDDYIQMENVRATKVRAEFNPNVPYLEKVRVDAAFSWYQLDSATDRWNAGANLRDRTGNSGDDLGKEFDVRVRFPLGQYAALNLGYAYFWAGDFIKDAIKLPANANNPNRSDTSNFFYSELTLYGF